MNAATERQNQAAQPNMNTWLAANAGSGKTRVLTDRVARLLLGGTDPQKILCLTYTKAAAGEMQNRLFQRLGEWAMLEDAQLRAVLVGLGVGTDIPGDQLRRARTLFAKAIETPGGLKIQTIHSFCASLLRRFPLEAGVSPAFREMDDRAAALMKDEILNDMAEGPDRPVIEAVCRHATDQSLPELVEAITGHRDAFAVPADLQQLRRALGVGPDETLNTVVTSVVLGDESTLLDSICPVLEQHKSTDSKGAATLRGIRAWDHTALPVLEKLFLFGETAKTPFAAKLSSFPTKDCREALGADLDQLQALMMRVEDARPRRLAVLAADKAFALHQFATAFLQHLESRKRAQGWLDFDDLIRITRRLLDTSDMSEWVLYKLDGGIDHILVDEAQDTSPEQWDIIERIAREFTAGDGAREGERTLFVVGDQKQSIYSFQGADPREFSKMQAEFRSRFQEVGSGLQDLTLEYSFRSSDAILRLVDLVFEGKEDSGFAADGQHRAFKSDLPGRVDLWPPVPEATPQEDGHWTDPVDRPSPMHHTRILADQIADEIGRMLAERTPIPIDGNEPGTFAARPIKPGDFLILLQRRSDLFSEIIRACKARNLPIAGADRLRVGAELAVKDLASLLRFLATPEDSLSLAEVLRSPLFGWDEQALYDLAHKRDTPFLWQALRQRRDEFERTLAVLDDLRRQADFLRPFDLIERILTRHRGRQRLIARLGKEAEDGINALLSQALAYEQNQIPGLTGFLVWMETNDLEIKRQSDTSGDLIRVMTVHGAKGLEAPIVILPDTGVRRMPQGSEILLADDIPLWRVPKSDMPPNMKQALEERQQVELRERDRLLYVALTRAEKWLIIAAAGKTGDVGDSWYATVQDALTRAGALPEEMPDGMGLRLSHLDWDELPCQTDGRTDAVPTHAPEPSFEPTKPQLQKTVLSPSDLGGAKALPGEGGLDSDEATERGTHIHLLLEHLPDLPESQKREAAARLLPDDHDPDIIDEVETLLATKDLQFVFAGESLAEVTITADFGAQRLLGVIDRLIVSDDHIMAVDFKSKRGVPETTAACPEGILRQMGAYAHALKQVYPGRTIETAIVWTNTAQLMRMPHDIVTDALARTGWVDAAGGGS
ncbi:MAG: double-strand break repair helicase AddA [Paracoccaceae bacterium]